MFVTWVVAWVLGGMLAAFSRGQPLHHRVERLVLPFFGVVAVAGWWTSLAVRPMFSEWSAVRLLPSLMLRKGIPLYHLPGEGPVTGWIYPPLTPVAYLPATFMDEPAAMVLSGRVLSMCLLVLPLAAALFTGNGRDASSLTTRMAVFVVAIIAMHVLRPLRYVSTEILADCPAIALGLASLLVLARAGAAPRDGVLVAVAVLACAAAWSKQVAVGTPMVAPLVFALRGEPRVAARSFIITGLVGLLMTGLLAWWHGPMELWFNLVDIPSKHPWRTGVAAHFVDVLPQALPAVIAWAACMVVGMMASTERRPLDALSPAAPFVVSALCHAPLALMGYVKVGGDQNSLAHAVMPAMVGAAWLLAHVRARPAWVSSAVVAVGLAAAVPEAVGLHAVLTSEQTWHDERTIGEPGFQEQRRVTEHLRHSQDAWFPTHPLEHLAVDGHAWHFEYGLFDRELAGISVDDVHLVKYVPPGARFICYMPSSSFAKKYAARRLANMGEIFHVDELPGATCYPRRPLAGAPP